MLSLVDGQTDRWMDVCPLCAVMSLSLPGHPRSCHLRHPSPGGFSTDRKGRVQTDRALALSSHGGVQPGPASGRCKRGCRCVHGHTGDGLWGSSVSLDRLHRAAVVPSGGEERSSIQEGGRAQGAGRGRKCPGGTRSALAASHDLYLNCGAPGLCGDPGAVAPLWASTYCSGPSSASWRQGLQWPPVVKQNVPQAWAEASRGGAEPTDPGD